MLLWALWVPGADLGILQAKPNGAPEAALHTDFGLGIKHRMIGESEYMMGIEWDNFFMFYSTIFLFLCYMDTHLTTRLVVSRHGMYQCMKPPTDVLQIALDAPGARGDVSMQLTYL